MHHGQIVFAQLMEFLPQHAFRKCVARYQGNYRMRSFSCYDQFLCMAFAQLTLRESLRDIECCLRALEEKLLPCRHPRPSLSQHAGRCQRNPRLAHLCRFCATAHRSSPQALPQREFWRPTQRNGFMPWIPARSICACRCFPGHGSGKPKPESNCIPCWICVGAFPPSLPLPRPSCTMSISSISWSRSRGPFT